MPAPPRIAVLAFFHGSQANPIRGSKLCNVGLEKNEPAAEHPVITRPHTGDASERLRRTAIFPAVSLGTVAIS